jgi:hypothetical protein
MSPTIYRVAFVALSTCLFAVPVCAQDKSTRGAVQEDPILRSADLAQADSEGSLELPSDAERSRDSKVQEDPLLSGLSDRASATAKPAPPKKDAGDRPVEQASAPQPAETEVERDPILGEKADRKPPSKRTRRSDRDQQGQDEEQPDADRRLVPKPKDSSVQEDPLMRSVDPPG